MDRTAIPPRRRSPPTPLIARARAGPANSAPRSASPAGNITAAPTPCTTRPVIRTPADGATRHTTEPAPNTASPTRNRAPPAESSDRRAHRRPAATRPQHLTRRTTAPIGGGRSRRSSAAPASGSPSSGAVTLNSSSALARHTTTSVQRWQYSAPRDRADKRARPSVAGWGGHAPLHLTGCHQRPRSATAMSTPGRPTVGAAAEPCVAQHATAGGVGGSGPCPHPFGAVWGVRRRVSAAPCRVALSSG